MIISFLVLSTILAVDGWFSILPTTAPDSTPFVTRIEVAGLEPESTYKFTIYVYGGHPSPGCISERWIYNTLPNRWKGGYTYTDFIPNESGEWQQVIPLRIVKKPQEGYDYYIKFKVKFGAKDIFSNTVHSTEGFQVLDMSKKGGWLAGTVYLASDFASPAEEIIVLPSVSDALGAYLTEDNKIDEGNPGVPGRFYTAIPVGSVDKIEFQNLIGTPLNGELGSSPPYEITAGETTCVDPFYIKDVEFIPDYPESGDSVIIRPMLCNPGEIINNCSLLVICNGNEIETVVLDEIPAHSCTAPQIVWRNLPNGKHKLQIQVKNNDFIATAFYYLQVGSGDVLINEIMYHPSTSGEWIEITNCSTNLISLKNWTIEDPTTKNIITEEDKWLSSGEFAVIAESTSSTLKSIYDNFHSEVISLGSSFPNLRDNGDTIILRDGDGIIQDILKYDGNWATNSTKGISLERISPAIATNFAKNWGSCVIASGATPGKVNSIYVSYLPSNTQLSVHPEVFSPKSEKTFISYTLPFTQASVRLYLYDRCGRCVCKLVDGSPSGARSREFQEKEEITWSHIWDGKNDEGEFLPIGIYIVYLEAKDQNSDAIISKKTTVVIGK